MLPLIALPQVDVFIFGVWSYLSAFILILLTLLTYVWVYVYECGYMYMSVGLAMEVRARAMGVFFSSWTLGICQAIGFA